MLDYLADTEVEECNLKPAKEVFAFTAEMTSAEVRVSFEGLTRKHKHVHTKCGAQTACMKAMLRDELLEVPYARDDPMPCEAGVWACRCGRRKTQEEHGSTGIVVSRAAVPRAAGRVGAGLQAHHVAAWSNSVSQ